MNDFIIVYSDELYHHGIKGMKWGVRKMQNKYYGSYTKAGIKRFNKSLENYESKDKIYKDKKKYAGKTKVTYTENDGTKQSYSLFKSINPEYHRENLQADKNKGLIKDYKISEGATKQDVQKAKIDRKEAKYRLKADYKHLKQDKLADKGKMLYAGGKTITGNKAVTSTLATIGGLSLAAAAKLGSNRRIMLNTGKRMKAINPAAVLSAVGAATIAGATAKKAYDWDRNRKLRAYYGHTSNY